MDRTGADFYNVLDMIKKQAQLAESKLNLQSGQEIEGIGEKLSDIYAQVESGDKYGGGAAKKAISKLEGKNRMNLIGK